MATQADNVLDPDELSRLRNSVRGLAENITEQVAETTEDVVSYATQPVRELFYDPSLKAYAFGLFSGVAISLIVKHLG